MKKEIKDLGDGAFNVTLIPETEQEIEESKNKNSKALKIKPNVERCRVFPIIFEAETFCPTRYISLGFSPEKQDLWSMSCDRMSMRHEIHAKLDEVLDNPSKYDLDNQNLLGPLVLNPESSYESLLNKIKKLQHEYDCTRGLWCTDKPELIPEEHKDQFFQLT